MKKFRILIILNSLVGVIGGGSRHIVEASNYWNNYHEVNILISKPGYKIAKNYINPNINIITYSTLFDRYRRSYFNTILVYVSRLIASCFYVNRLEKYDIIISANYQQQNVFPVLLKKLLNRNKSKIVAYYHESSPFLKKKSILVKIFSILNWNFSLFLIKKYFDLIFVVNIETRDYLIRNNIPPNKIAISSNAIYYKEIIEIENEHKEYECVFLGRLVERKGVHDLIKIWKIIVTQFPLAKLCIIGEGQEKDKIQREIREEKLEKNIIVTGSVSEKEKYRLLKKSKIFVYPSYQEGWGIVIAEALACELIVVTYDLPVYKDVFREHILKVKIGDYGELSNKIIFILKNLPNYDRQIMTAKNFVSGYDWEEVSKKELLNIQNLIEKSS